MEYGEKISLEDLKNQQWEIIGTYAFFCYIMGKDNNRILYDYEKGIVILCYSSI